MKLLCWQTLSGRFQLRSPWCERTWTGPAPLSSPHSALSPWWLQCLFPCPSWGEEPPPWGEEPPSSSCSAQLSPAGCWPGSQGHVTSSRSAWCAQGLLCKAVVPPRVQDLHFSWLNFTRWLLACFSNLARSLWRTAQPPGDELLPWISHHLQTCFGCPCAHQPGSTGEAESCGCWYVPWVHL